MKEVLNMELTQQIAQELLDYDPETGELRWRHRARSWFKSLSDQKRWNSKNAGKKALAYQDPETKYLSGRIFRKAYQAHRVIWIREYGEIPAGMFIDHRDNVRDNNRISNLRLATKAQNNRNKTPLAGATSRYLGVRKHTSGQWTAQIGHDYKSNHIGTYGCETSAALAYDRAAIKYFGEFANLNCKPRQAA